VLLFFQMDCTGLDSTTDRDSGGVKVVLRLVHAVVVLLLLVVVVVVVLVVVVGAGDGWPDRGEASPPPTLPHGFACCGMDPSL